MPYLCSTAKKISAVAAAIRVAISHSSKWSSARLRPLSTRTPQSQPKRPRSAITPGRFLLIVGAASRSSVHLDVEFFGDQIEHLLPDATFRPLVGRRHRRLPRFALSVGQGVQRGLAGFFDLGQRILVFLDCDGVRVIGGFIHRLVELLPDIGRQPVPKLGVHDHCILQMRVIGERRLKIIPLAGRSNASHLSFLKENVMFEQPRPYEPLTSENAALILIDHQVGLMTGVRDYSTGELKHNVVGLAKAAKALKLPIIVTTTARDSMWGPTFPELVEALPGVPIVDRSSVNAFDDPKVAQAITVTGRKKLIFAGISLEVCAAFPAITAVGKGLDAYVAVDASGTFSETKRQVGLLRMLQAGVILSDYATLMVEILKDNARPEAGPIYGAIDMPWAKLVGQIAQAYGK